MNVSSEPEATNCPSWLMLTVFTDELRLANVRKQTNSRVSHKLTRESALPIAKLRPKGKLVNVWEGK